MNEKELSKKNTISSANIAGTFKHIKQYIADILGHSTTSTTPLFLPENIRYALNNNEGIITKSDIESLLHNTKYESIGLYLTARFLKPTGKTEQFLGEICNYIYSTHNYDYNHINDICKKYMCERADVSMRAHKLGYISRRGFNIDVLFEDTYKSEPLRNDSIPVIILYAGILGLPKLAHLYPDKPVLFYDPKHCMLLGYNVDGKKTIQKMDFNILKNNNHITLIDDAIQSGNTIQEVKNMIKEYNGSIHINYLIPMKPFKN